MRTSHVLVLAAGLASAWLSLACAALTVHSTVGPNVNFEAYRTFRWADDGPRATGDPRLDANPFFEGHLASAADRELAARGYEKSADATADLVLHYHANFSQQFDISQRDAGYTQGASYVTGSVYDAGTIVLDLVDARTNTLIWRGWAEGSMDGAIDNQQLMEERIDEVVRRIVATVPRHL